MFDIAIYEERNGLRRSQYILSVEAKHGQEAFYIESWHDSKYAYDSEWNNGVDSYTALSTPSEDRSLCRKSSKLDSREKISYARAVKTLQAMQDNAQHSSECMPGNRITLECHDMRHWLTRRWPDPRAILDKVYSRMQARREARKAEKAKEA